MQVSIDEIKQRLYSDFSNIYRAFGGFVDSGKLWDLCLEAVSDQVLMGNIIFCNDVHQIPPVHTFLKVVASEITWELTGLENAFPGRFLGFCLSACVRIPEAEECYREGKHCADGNLLLRPAGAS